MPSGKRKAGKGQLLNLTKRRGQIDSTVEILKRAFSPFGCSVEKTTPSKVVISMQNEAGEKRRFIEFDLVPADVDARLRRFCKEVGWPIPDCIREKDWDAGD